MNEYFIKGLENRKHDPIVHGLFKLKELKGRMHQILNELNIIHEIHRRKKECWELSLCTHEDAHIWIKTIPEIILYQMANKLMSSVDALSTQGINAQKIYAIKKLVSNAIIKLVKDCEFTIELIKRQPPSWNKQWGYTEDSVQKLLIQFIRVLDAIALKAK